ncbi:N-acetylmuramoyl-L-alanine amidase [Ruegeria sp. THAF33]|uniref:N-acetylmuramoyl-L-alanine amidase n=1 Tax=Ruegeria sp. THAF33 TaxID=2587853 RepID=UPI001268B337|nr:N-acetylmuramoyl-L-alanine amidase [Ruegeria sp. THAF33]QFT74021.1 N-acetylmuramoyl-L-alanine amidase [Ruegeria sp. THAF33]
MLNIKRADTYLRTSLFATLPREKTTGLFVRYTHHPPDPRIDATIIDVEHAKTGRFGIGWHFLVLVDGTVELCRHPLTCGAVGRDNFTRSHIQIGVVGGRDRETGKFSETLTDTQREALEALYQKLADTLGVPLEIDESLEKFTTVQHDQDEAAEAELEERLDRNEAMTTGVY